MNRYSKLILFNLELNSESTLLGSNTAWVEAFMENFEKVVVISTRVGKIPHSLNEITVLELGGGTIFKRLRALVKLAMLIPNIYTERKKSVIFHHMSHYTAIFPGVIVKLFRIRQGMWYSHEKRSFALRLATHIVDIVYSPSRESFPLRTNKLRDVGQAIDVTKFGIVRNLEVYQRTGEIVTIGRISRSKHLDSVYSMISDSPTCEAIWFVGPIHDEEYRNEIASRCKDFRVEAKFPGPIHPGEVPNLLGEFCYYFSGTTKGVDRALIEAGVSGCLILTTNIGALRLIGMSNFWAKELGIEVPNLKLQYHYFNSLTNGRRRDVAEYISSFTIKNNDVHSTVKRILYALEGGDTGN